MTFAEELIRAAQPEPIESHPFIAQVRSGDATRDAIRSFALHTSSATESFVRALYAVLSVCTDVRARQSLIGNVLEEEGATSFTAGAGVMRFNEAKRHPTMARRFALAAGAEEHELDAFHVGPPNWFHRQIRAGNWIGPFAYIAVGTEANVPPTFRQLIPALSERYGMSDADLEFLIEHVSVDDRHGIEGAMLIASLATTDEARRQALDGARRGGRGWWEILRRHVTAPAGVGAA